MAIKEGNKAPAFSLEDNEGNKRSLKEFTEDFLVLFFYPKDNTPGCTIEAKGFTTLKTKFKNIGAIPIGISGGDLKSKQKFCEKAGLETILLSDPDGTTGAKYDSYGTKKFMGKTFDGFHRKTIVIGPDRKIIKIYEKVKPEEHPQEVLEFIKDYSKKNLN